MKLIRKKNCFRSLKIFLLTLLILFSINSLVYAQNNIFLFSSKGEFLEIDVTKGEIARKGNLWKSGIHKLYSGKLDYKSGRIYLKSDYSIYVLELATLELVKKIETQLPDDLMNLYLSPNGSRIIISGVYNEDGGVLSKSYDGENLSELKSITCDSIEDTSHFINLNEFACIETKAGERSLSIVDIEQNKILKTILFKSILDNLESGERVVEMEAANGRFLLLRTYTNKNNQKKSKRELVVFDYSTNKLTKEIALKKDGRGIYGQYLFIPKTKKIVVDEYKVTQLQKNLVKTHKKGKLIIYDADTAKRLAMVKVPKQGKILGYSSNEKYIYYWSPALLTIIDMESKKAVKSVQLPSGEQIDSQEVSLFNILVSN